MSEPLYVKVEKVMGKALSDGEHKTGKLSTESGIKPFVKFMRWAAVIVTVLWLCEMAGLFT